MPSFKKVKSLKTIILFQKCCFVIRYILHIIQKYISKNIHTFQDSLYRHGSINHKSEMEGLHYFQKKIQLKF